MESRDLRHEKRVSSFYGGAPDLSGNELSVHGNACDASTLVSELSDLRSAGMRYDKVGVSIGTTKERKVHIASHAPQFVLVSK